MSKNCSWLMAGGSKLKDRGRRLDEKRTEALRRKREDARYRMNSMTVMRVPPWWDAGI